MTNTFTRPLPIVNTKYDQTPGSSPAAAVLVASTVSRCNVTDPSPFASTPECTADDPTNLRAGKVSGTLTIDEMLAVANNGVAAGEWEEVLSLIRAGRTYANVHSGKFPGGEVRAQLDNGDDDQDDHGHQH